MKGLFSRLAFTGFGPSALSDAAPTLCPIVGKRPSQLRDKVRHSCPRRPGIYGMVDPAGELIYVGKAKCLRTRLLSYFRRKSRDPKAGRIVESTRLIAWEYTPSEFAALLRELELIRRWQPRFNVQGQPKRRRRTYICVGRQPAPYVYLAAKPPSSAQTVYGPVPSGETVREAVRRINDWYRLRDCPQTQEMHFAEQNELFPMVHTAGCIRHEISACSGPCAAACSRGDYADQVKAARRFLDGEDRTPLQTIEREMAEASAALSFELAASLRDRLNALRWLQAHLARVRSAARDSFVYPVASYEGGQRWYLVTGGRVRTSVPVPRTESQRQTTAELLKEVFRGNAAKAPPSVDEIDGVLLVAAWFRKYGEERARTLSLEQALRMCQIRA